MHLARGSPNNFFLYGIHIAFLKPGMKFFDVGMGSGILSLLAIRLGAEMLLY
jgi:ribosomal protein L11 methylase PrmA